MLYVIYGSDQARAREKFNQVIAALRAKKPAASFFTCRGDEFSLATWEELVRGQTLFEKKYIVAGQHLLGGEASGEPVLASLAEVAEAPHAFILLEGELTKPVLKKLSEFAHKIERYEVAEAEAKDEFNIFSLTDALGRRDRRGLWVLTQKARGAGFATEEVFYKLVWQTKTMLLVAVSGGAKTDLKPFVETKTKRFLANFSLTELRQLSAKLVALYHDARRGLVDFELGLEKLVLEI